MAELSGAQIIAKSLKTQGKSSKWLLAAGISSLDPEHELQNTNRRGYSPPVVFLPIFIKL